MGDYRGEHFGATQAAIEAVAIMQEHIAMATERGGEALAAIQAAVGDSQIESANNATQFIAGTLERLSECYGVTVQAVSELQRYAGGF